MRNIKYYQKNFNCFFFHKKFLKIFVNLMFLNYLLAFHNYNIYNIVCNFYSFVLEKENPMILPLVKSQIFTT